MGRRRIRMRSRRGHVIVDDGYSSQGGVVYYVAQ